MLHMFFSLVVRENFFSFFFIVCVYVLGFFGFFIFCFGRGVCFQDNGSRRVLEENYPKNLLRNRVKVTAK